MTPTLHCRSRIQQWVTFCRSVIGEVGLKKGFHLIFFPSRSANGHFSIAACLLVCCNPNKIVYYHISISKWGVSLLSHYLASHRVKLPQSECDWGFKPSGLWRFVIERVVPDILKDLWRWRLHHPLKCQESVAHWHNVTSQMTWIVNVGYGSCSVLM